MLPKVAIVQIADAQKMPLPRYADGVGTSMILRAANVEAIKIAPQHWEVIDTGLAIAVPLGMEAQVRSLKESTTSGVLVINAPATIDASDRKEIKVCLYNASQESVIVKRGDAVALLVFAPALRIEWLDMTQKIVTHIQEKQTQILNQVEQEKPAETHEDVLVEIGKQEAVSQDDTTEVVVSPEEFEPLDTPETEINQTSEPIAPPAVELPDILQEAPLPEPVLEEDIQPQTAEEPKSEPVLESVPEPEHEAEPESEPQTEHEAESAPITDIEPPAILAEFEKMEQAFYDNAPVPEAPEVPNIPDIPEVPEMTDIPDIPEVPEVPEEEKEKNPDA